MFSNVPIAIYFRNLLETSLILLYFFLKQKLRIEMKLKLIG